MLLPGQFHPLQKAFSIATAKEELSYTCGRSQRYNWARMAIESQGEKEHDGEILKVTMLRTFLHSCGLLNRQAMGDVIKGACS